jgi:hypothetical protein
MMGTKFMWRVVLSVLIPAVAFVTGSACSTETTTKTKEVTIVNSKMTIEGARSMVTGVAESTVPPDFLGLPEVHVKFFDGAGKLTYEGSDQRYAGLGQTFEFSVTSSDDNAESFEISTTGAKVLSSEMTLDYLLATSEVTGTAENTGNTKFDQLILVVKFYDEEGSMIWDGEDNALDLKPGETYSFRVICVGVAESHTITWHEA